MRLLALIALAILAFAANAYAQQYWAGLLFPRVTPRPYTEMLSAALVGALVAAAIVAIPLAKVFARRACLAALVVPFPVLALKGPEVVSATGPYREAILVMAWVEMVSYTFAIVFGTWLISRSMRNRAGAP